MSISSAQKIAQLVLKEGVPSEFSYNSLIEDLVNAIPDIYQIQLPGNIQAKYLYVSAGAPGSEAQGSLWLRTNGAGVPIDLNYFLDN